MPASAQDPTPFDALLLIEQATKGISGPATGEAIAKGLDTAAVCGANGCFHMSATDHNGLPPDAMVLLRAHDGRWALSP